MGMPTDQVETATGKMVLLYSTDPREGGMPGQRGPSGEALVSVRKQTQQGKNMGKSIYCGFCKKKQVRQGGQV